MRENQTSPNDPANDEPADTVSLVVDRADLRELYAILDADRYRMDKGDDRPVPQPRWGANVRVSKAVMAALAPAATPPEPVNDELARHLDWSFWGTGMADTFREPLAETMLAAISPEQRQQANDLITRWRDHREFVGRDKYEEQKAEIERLRAAVEQALQVIDDGPQMVNDRVEEHWTVVVSRAAKVLGGVLSDAADGVR